MHLQKKNNLPRFSIEQTSVTVYPFRIRYVFPFDLKYGLPRCFKSSDFP